MDITDVEGDREGGVRTLPVLMGRDSALAFAAALLTVGVSTAVVGIVRGECLCGCGVVVPVLCATAKIFAGACSMLPYVHIQQASTGYFIPGIQHYCSILSTIVVDHLFPRQDRFI